jgi:hypothetical protein
VRFALLCALGLAACGDGTTRRAVDAAVRADAGLSVPASNREPIEVLPFYRSRESRSVMVLPARLSAPDAKRGWEDMAGHPMLRVQAGDEQAMLIPSAPAAQWPLEEVEELARTYAPDASLPVARQAGLVTIGPDASGRVVFGLRIVDGEDAAVFALAGPEPTARADLEWIASHTRVGAKVPRLVDRTPEPRRGGVYRSGEQWAIFDPRGYVSLFAPTAEAHRDVEVMVQWATLDPTMPVFTYDGDLKLRSLDGQKTFALPIAEYARVP